LKKYAKNASHKFELSRFSWSKEAYDKSKEIIQIPSHFYFQTQFKDAE
jgi:hypothetical protein